MRITWPRVGTSRFAFTEPPVHRSHDTPFLYKTQGDSDWFREAVNELDVALGTWDDNPISRFPVLGLGSRAADVSWLEGEGSGT
jgi:hypothetical protein